MHAVLTRLKEKGLTLNGDKCQFRLPKLTFFGHELSRQGVAPSEEKVAAILKANPPQDASQIRSFVQLVQYSAKFLLNCARSRTTQEPPEEELALSLRKNEPVSMLEGSTRKVLPEVETASCTGSYACIFQRRL